MKSTAYWAHNGKHQAIADQLQKLIPTSGPVEKPYKNKKLERFRKAVNAYYDLYNNGGINRASSISKLFDVTLSSHKDHSMGKGYFRQSLFNHVEEKMNEIIMEAAVEQNIHDGLTLEQTG